MDENNTITLAFKTEAGSGAAEYSHTFKTGDSLEPILENVELFLRAMGFEGDRLVFQTNVEKPLDKLSGVAYNRGEDGLASSVAIFPTRV